MLKRLTRADWLAVAFITCAAALFFAPVWAGGGWLPNGGGDLTSLLWPNFRFASRLLKAGQLPLWNPHLFGGMPFWADNQSAILYPPNLLVLLLTNVPLQALEALVIFHIWFTGLAMYACLRLLDPEQPFSPAAATLGAVAWMFSDVFVTHIGNLNLNAVSAWLPLIFLGVWRAVRDQDVRWAIFAGVTFGLSTLAGHAQMTYLIALTIAAAFVWLVGETLIGILGDAERDFKRLLKPIYLFILTLIIALGLSAASLLPTVELTQQTARAALPYEQGAAYSLPPRALIGLLWPNAIGRGPAGFTGAWDRVEIGYMGLITLLLTLSGIWIGWRKQRSLTLFAALLAVISLLLALGQYFPLHRMAYGLVPGLDQIRVPARFVLLFNFGGAILAALALHYLTAGRRQWLAWLVVVVAAGELILNGAWVEVQYDDPRVGYQHTEIYDWLAEQPGAPGAPYRIDSQHGDWQPHTAQWLEKGLYDIHGFSQPLKLVTYDSYYWSVGYRGSPMYNFLGAKYVIAGSEAPGDASFVPAFTAADGMTVYLNTGALPLAHLLYRGVGADSADQAWEPVHSPDWNPAEVVYVEGGLDLNGVPPEGASLSYFDYQPHRIELLVNTPEPAYLVLSEVYYPGWQATIDGEESTIYKANIAFRAIYIAEPGEHRVVLRFRPLTVYLGLIITGITVVALGIYQFRSAQNSSHELHGLH